MKAFRLFNPIWPMSEIDIIIDAPVDYKKAVKNFNRILIKNVSIPIISIGDLIKMKQKANRDQDRADIRYLKKLKNEKK
jgi:hypothetical protein